MNSDINPKLKDFLYKHYIDEENPYYNFQTKYPKGGKYLIPSDKIDSFWTIYQDILRDEKNPMLSMLETVSSAPYIPMLADFDIKVDKDDDNDDDTDYSSYTYSEHHVKTVIKIYQDVLREVVNNITERNLFCVLLEKPLKSIYNEKTNVTTYKRGFHLHFPGIFLHRKSIKEYVLPRVKTLLTMNNVFADLGITNSASLCDDCVVGNAWFLYGSKKDDISDPYLVSKIYDIDLEEIDIKDAFKDYMIFDGNEELLDIKSDINYYLPRILSIVPQGRPTFDIKVGVSSGLKKENPEKKKKTFVSISAQEALKVSAELIPMLSEERASEYNEWINIGFILYCIGDGCEEALQQWIEFSERCPEKFDENGCHAEWNKMVVKNYTLGSLKYYAEIDNPVEFAKWKAEHYKKYTQKILNENSHYDVAKLLYEEHGEEFRYDPVYKTWFQFKRHIWKEDPDAASLQERIPTNIVDKIEAEINTMFRQENAMNMADKSGQQTYAEKIKQYNKIKEKCKSTNFQSGIMKQCNILFREEGFRYKLDKDKYKIAFTNGVYDLKTNKFRSGRPDDYLGKNLPIRYIEFDPNCQEVKDFERFLQQVFPNNELRRHFIDVSSDVFEGGNKQKTIYFWTGEGDNAKSITQDMFESMLGEKKFLVKLTTTVVTGKKVGAGQANPDLAQLDRGVRMVVMEEPDKSEELNIGLLKAFSGGDSFSARELYQKGSDAPVIKPMCKLVFICNGLPPVRQSDQAFWNRVKVFMFESKFVKNDDENPPPATYEEQLLQKRFPRDENFRDKIPGMVEVMAWYLLNHRMKLIKGIIKRMPEPEIVREATKEYQKQNNSYIKFIEENFIEDKKGNVLIVDLYNDYREWYKNTYPRSDYPNRDEVERYFNKRWGQSKQGKWVGWRKRKLEDDIEQGEVIFLEDEDLCFYEDK